MCSTWISFFENITFEYLINNVYPKLMFQIALFLKGRYLHLSYWNVFKSIYLVSKQWVFAVHDKVFRCSILKFFSLSQELGVFLNQNSFRCRLMNISWSLFVGWFFAFEWIFHWTCIFFRSLCFSCLETIGTVNYRGGKEDFNFCKFRYYFVLNLWFCISSIQKGDILS